MNYIRYRMVLPTDSSRVFGRGLYRCGAVVSGRLYVIIKKL